MKKYTGTKTIKAKSMTLGTYNKSQGWDMPEGENPKASGYLVGYSDAKGNFDGPLQDGCHHISWSPKDVFEAAYSEGDGENLQTDKVIPTEKTFKNSDVSGAHKNVSDLRIFGDGDKFQLICKASSENEGWMKSTKAMEIPGIGCVVQVTTQQKNADGSYGVAEALTFVPGARLVGNSQHGRELVPVK